MKPLAETTDWDVLCGIAESVAMRRAKFAEIDADEGSPEWKTFAKAIEYRGFDHDEVERAVAVLTSEELYRAVATYASRLTWREQTVMAARLRALHPIEQDEDE